MEFHSCLMAGYYAILYKYNTLFPLPIYLAVHVLAEPLFWWLRTWCCDKHGNAPNSGCGLSVLWLWCSSRWWLSPVSRSSVCSDVRRLPAIFHEQHFLILESGLVSLPLFIQPLNYDGIVPCFVIWCLSHLLGFKLLSGPGTVFCFLGSRASPGGHYIVGTHCLTAA